MPHPELLQVLNDPERLRTLAETDLLDSAAEPAFDRLTRMAAKLLEAKVALVSLVDARRQFFKSAYGLQEPFATERETPLSHSLCQYSVGSGEPLLVEDATQHPLFRHHPATSDMGVVAYAGVPLITAGQKALGVLCVVDDKPRHWQADQLELLRDLAQSAAAEIELRLALRRLSSSEAMFRALAESASDAIVSADSEGNIVLWNRAAEEMFGYSAEDVLHKPLTLLMPARFQAAHLAGLKRVAQGGAPALLGRSVEVTARRKSGEEFSVELSLARWTAHRHSFFTAILRDVTLRKLSAAALRRSEEQFRLTIDTAPIGMGLVGLDGRFLRVNKALSDIVGYEPERLVTLTFQQITHPDDLAADLALVTRLLAGEIPSYHLPKRYVHQSGALIDVKLHVALVRDRAGAPQHFTIQVEDVTAKNRAEAELAHKTMILESVLNHTSDGVIVADKQGEVLLFNPAAQRMWGRPATANADWAAEYGLLEADAKTPLAPGGEPLQRALRGEHVEQHELFVAPRGHQRGAYRSVTATPLRDPEGGIWAALSVQRDITRAKESELSLREQAAIIRLLEAVAAAANEATTSSRAMSDSLKLVCEFMGWPVGHVYLVEGDRLLPTELWHMRDPGRYAELREVTQRTPLSVGLGLPGRVLATRRPAWMEDVESDAAFVRAHAVEHLGVHGGIAFPVLVRDEVFAVMEFYSDAPAAPDVRALEVMHHVGTQLGRVVERERHAEAVRSLSLTDELTGLNNRRGFLALAEAQLRLSVRARTPATLLFIDMDGLKQINDQLGHEMGDQAITELAQVLRGTFRESDVLGRLGGDEFVVLLPDTTALDPHFSSSRLQERLGLYNASGARPYKLAVSIGVTGFDPERPDDIETLLGRADRLMYEDKRRRKGLAARRSSA